MERTQKETWIEEGTELSGALKASCRVVVHGSIDGQIEAPAVTVSATGTVVGKIKAEVVRSEGTLAGVIEAEEVQLAGTVRRDTTIRARKLDVKLTSERGELEACFGECVLEIGDDPARLSDTAASAN